MKKQQISETSDVGRECSAQLSPPSACWLRARANDGVFEDETALGVKLTLEALAAQLPVPIQIVHGAADVVDSVLGAVGKSP